MMQEIGYGLGFQDYKSRTRHEKEGANTANGVDREFKMELDSERT